VVCIAVLSAIGASPDLVAREMPGAMRIAVAPGAAEPAGSQAQAVPFPTMAPFQQYLPPDRNSEIDLARSAAPAALSGKASVLVLTPRGYEKAATGTNGFVCMVDRAWLGTFGDPEFWNPKVRSPVCLNPQAAKAVLPIVHKRTGLVLAGLSKTEIMSRIKTAFERKELNLPEIGAMSYMMSKEQHLSDQVHHWHPHLMFYLPGTVESATWGANLLDSPVVAGPGRLPDGSREPIHIFLVPVGQWSDGTAAPPGHH